MRLIPQDEDAEELELNPEVFALALQMHQERLKKTQPEMAELLGIKPRTYWQWRSGTGNPLAVTMEGAIARLKKTKPGK